MPHHILCTEMGERDAAHFFQNLFGLHEPAFLMFRQIDLGNIAGYDSFRAETDTGQEHFHLFRSSILRLIEYYKRLVQCASAHKGERRDFDRTALELLAGFVKTHQVVKRVI